MQVHPDFAAQASTADETDRAEDGQVEMEAA